MHLIVISYEMGSIKASSKRFQTHTHTHGMYAKYSTLQRHLTQAYCPLGETQYALAHALYPILSFVCCLLWCSQRTLITLCTPYPTCTVVQSDHTSLSWSPNWKTISTANVPLSHEIINIAMRGRPAEWVAMGRASVGACEWN